MAAIAAIALVGLVVITLLTAILTSAAGPFLAGVLVTAPTSTAARIATEDAAMTPTGADWYTFRSWAGGFQVDVPGAIGSSHGYFINDFSGQGVDLYYIGAPISSPLQQRESQIWVSILYSTKIADRNICPQGGTGVKIGFGQQRVQAWVRDEGRVVAVNLVFNGTAIEITLDSRDESQPALARYSDIWRHMLTSFTLLPVTHRLTTHPCE